MIGAERDVPKDDAAAVITEADMVELDVADNFCQRNRPFRIVIFRLLGQDFMGPLQSRNGFGQLGAD